VVAVAMVVLSGCAQPVEEQAAPDDLDCDTEERVSSSSSWDDSGPPTFASPDLAVRDWLGLDDDAVLQVGDVGTSDGTEEVEVLVQTDGRWQATVKARHDGGGWYADGVTECA
jgi:hypothetical protein